LRAPPLHPSVPQPLLMSKPVFDKLPKLAQEYLSFVEKESGAKIGMVSTGPDRDQTMMLPEFDQALKA